LLIVLRDRGQFKQKASGVGTDAEANPSAGLLLCHTGLKVSAFARPHRVVALRSAAAWI
jgi:hypothetical protein